MNLLLGIQLALCFGASSVGPAVDAAGQVAFIPDDATFLIRVDVGQLAKSKLGAMDRSIFNVNGLMLPVLFRRSQLQAQASIFDVYGEMHMLRRFVKLAELDMSRDVDVLWLASGPSTFVREGKLKVETLEWNMGGFALGMEGRFHPLALRARFKELANKDGAIKITESAGSQIYRFTMPLSPPEYIRVPPGVGVEELEISKKMNEAPWFASVLDDKRIVIAPSENALLDTLKRHRKSKDAKSHSAITERLLKEIDQKASIALVATRDAIVSACGGRGPSRDGTSNAEVLWLLQLCQSGIENIEGTVEASDDLRVRIVITCKEEGKSKEVADAIAKQWQEALIKLEQDRKTSAMPAELVLMLRAITIVPAGRKVLIVK
jgi:hypothetical protein